MDDGMCFLILFIESMLHNTSTIVRMDRYAPAIAVAFFDDNPSTWHKLRQDIPVVGMPECLLKEEWSGKIDEVIVSLSEEKTGRVEELTEMLKPLHLKVTIASRGPVAVEA